jgi:hypothetical protein
MVAPKMLELTEQHRVQQCQAFVRSVLLRFQKISHNCDSAELSALNAFLWRHALKHGTTEEGFQKEQFS